MIGILLLGLCAVFAAPGNLYAENDGKPKKIEDSFYTVLEQALNVNIAARVSEAGENAVWNVESTELTVPGKSISVRLVGSNIVIVAQFTPYIGEGDSLILLAQGQVWISSPAEESMKYLATLKSIPITLGERVLFFPLGVKSLEQKSGNMYNIELEIKILPHISAPETGSGK